MSRATPQVLITGGLGFLGRAVAKEFRKIGAKVLGLGHGEPSEAALQGYRCWVQGDVSIQNLSLLNEKFDIVVHCAGRSSVAQSIEDPVLDFNANVDGTIQLLEYLRKINPDAFFVFASSAAVYGSAPDQKLRTTEKYNPVSPYGVHKTMAELLLRSYRQTYGLRSVAVRFFSIYGPGLRRQLLWDAAQKLTKGLPVATFWGTGEETRDWIHVDDAARYITKVANVSHRFEVINGASGTRTTIMETLEGLRRSLKSETKIQFNGEIRNGDPRYYHADIDEAKAIGWSPAISLEVGLKSYANWFQGN